MRYGTKKTLPHRDTTRMINIGGVVIGGGNPIAIQSMTNTETSDVDATVAQILELEKAGCQIIRSTANTEAAAKAFDKIKEQIHIPIVADIHFDYRLAILAMEYGADKIRINPGNIGGEENLKKVVKVAKERNIPIRVGVNSGSLERNLVEKYGGVTAEGIVESALDKVRMIEECDYDNLVISIKSSDVMMCVHAHELIAEQTSYPLHVGITEEYGADKIRINPGNIGGEENLKKVVKVAKERNIPIRVGVNSGSLERNLVEKYGGVTAEGIVESALDKVRMIEECDYDNLVISIKSSDVMMCVHAHELIAEQTSYPLHVGITEAGTVYRGNIKSAVGLGMILGQGIGDTMRVSLTGDPVEEITSAKLILRTLGLRKDGIELVSCPTCGRTKIDLIGLANDVEKLIAGYDHLSIKVAVMGCAVNGPGEAREADLGIAGGNGEGLLMKHGEIIKKVPQENLLAALKYELDHWEEE